MLTALTALLVVLGAPLDAGDPRSLPPADERVHDATDLEPQPPALLRADLDRWREHVRPSADELRYAQIDWAPSFVEGVRRAAADGRPLLLWLMNGHPLGCT